MTFMSKEAGRRVSSRMSTREYAARMFEALDTPKSLACYLLLKYKEEGQLVKMSVVPSDYLTETDFYLDYTAVSLLSKSEILDTGIDVDAVGMEKFKWAEYQCMNTNRRFEKRREGDLQFPPHVNAVLYRASRKVDVILGAVPSMHELDFRFGPGAAYGVRGLDTSVYKKAAHVHECTFAMGSILGEVFETLPSAVMDITASKASCRGSALMFVPKNAKTSRPICVEPNVNGLYQKGVGNCIRDRLRLWGVNLRDQAVNQKLAREAFAKELSTVDFSSASDTISYALVLDLVPEDWFEFLEIARSPEYEWDGDWRAFHKFTSMGNAYTFELETLIFFALASACCEELKIRARVGENLSVYGDDVIIPSEAFDLYSEVTSLCGFSVNIEKSHATGDFFESCGTDWFRGNLVRPFFLKGELVTSEDLYLATNNTLRTVETLENLPWDVLQANSPVHACDRLRDVHAWCIGCIPRKLRFPVPNGSGNGGLIAPFDVAVPRRPRPGSKQSGWDGWLYTAVRHKPVTVKIPSYDALNSPEGGCSMFYAMYWLGMEEEDVLRSVIGWQRGSTHVEQLREMAMVGLTELVDKGSGYSLRRRTRRMVKTSVWFGAWPDAPSWGDRSLRLVNKRM